MLSCKALVGCHGNQVSIGDPNSKREISAVMFKTYAATKKREKKPRVKRSKIFHKDFRHKFLVNLKSIELFQSGHEQ